MLHKKKFLGADWLLDTKEANVLYREVAIPLREQVGIVDTHTHHNLRQIVENRPFPNIWRAEVLEPSGQYANNDHYIIQLAAKAQGFSQAFARDPKVPDYDKWMALSRVFPELEGNHVHQWLHLDLKRMFGIDLLLDGDTGDTIWKEADSCLQEKKMLPQSILQQVRARVIFTTDDPSDDLRYHKMAEEIQGISFLPTFRPDAYCNIFSDDWRSNVDRICHLTNRDTTFKGFVGALRERHQYFAEQGARASDHGLLEPYGEEVSENKAEEIFHNAYIKKERYGSGSGETRTFISYMMHRFCEMNQESGMVTQIHYGALRNANTYLFRNWGADVGGDIALDRVNVVKNLTPLLTRFFSGETRGQSHLILYPMNQAYVHVQLMLERAFPNVHSGFPWWHNDTPYVMEQYILHAAGASLLSKNGGPVCDGRKILSVGSRFEVFDRVICRAVGKLVSDGQMSDAGGIRMVRALMYENQKSLFRLG